MSPTSAPSIRSAVEARKLRLVELSASPAEFSGTLDEMWELIEPNLPAPLAVASFHRQLVRYIQDPDSLKLLRAGTATERGQVYQTRDGTRFKATDNAPAWWVHYVLSQGATIDDEFFADVIASLPFHLFEVGRTLPAGAFASARGWHIAHLFNVKDGRSDFGAWSGRDVVSRFFRNIHPCNYFLLPKTEWQKWGGNERVLGYVGEKYRVRYVEVWQEFITLAGVSESTLVRMTGVVAYFYGNKPSPKPNEVPPANGSAETKCYRYSRLAFKADVIEPLSPNQRFRVVTPKGTFEFSKAEFYKAFPNVVQTPSYRKKGLYHVAKVPPAAEPFRIPEDQGK